MSGLTPEDREWVALTIADVASCRDTDDAARLIEARVETLIARHVTAALEAAAVEIEAKRITDRSLLVIEMGENSGLDMAAHHLRTAARDGT